MASRRLTISSLLCDDDDSAEASLAGPSTAHPIPSARDVGEPYAYSNHPQAVDHVPPYARELKSLPAVHDAIPLSLQPAASHLRRHTPESAPPPDYHPSIPPSASRRSYKEIAFDDYRDSPVSSSTSSRPFGDTSDPSPRRRSPELEPVRHPPSRTAIESLVHKRHYSASPSGRVSRLDLTAQSGYPEGYHPFQPEPPASTSYLRSPSHSPVVSHSSSQRRPSQSPLLSTTSSSFYTQSYASHYPYRPSLSPAHTSSPIMPVSAPPNSEPSYMQQHTPLADDAHYSPTLAKPTLSALLTHSPPVGRASLPHILNSPMMSRGHGLSFSAGTHSAITPGMEALEALAEVATQARQREHSETDGGMDDNGDTMNANNSPRASPVAQPIEVGLKLSPTTSRSPSTARLSPVVGGRVASRRSSPVAERTGSIHRSPMVDDTHASARSSPVVDYRSLAALPSPMVGVSPASPSPRPDVVVPPSPRDEVVDGHSESAVVPAFDHHATMASTSFVIQPAEPHRFEPVSPSIVTLVPSMLEDQPPRKRRRSSPVTPSVQTPQLPDLPKGESVKTEPSPKSKSPDFETEQVDLSAHSPKSTGPVHQISSAAVHPPPLPEPRSPEQVDGFTTLKLESALDTVASMPPSTAESPPVVKQRKTKQKVEGKKHPAKGNAKEHKAAPEPQPQQGSPQEEDAHEWLLEHYGGASSSAAPASSAGSRERVPSSNTPSHSPTTAHPSSASSRGKASHKAKQKSREIHDRTRTPTPVALLEEELELTEPHPKHEHVHAHGTHHASRDTREMDVDSELDFAVDDTYTKAPMQDSADMDVDAELLSLLDDDQPRPSSSRQPPLAPAAPSHEQTSRRSASPSKSAQVSPRIPSPAEKESVPRSSSANSHSLKKTGDIGASLSSKKKEPSQKAAPKKPPVKAKAKPKAKLKNVKKDGSATPAPAASSSTLSVPPTTGTGRSKKTPLTSVVATGLTAKRAVSTGVGASRSRSTSVMPGGADVEKTAEDENEEAAVDDKLYCICKTSYDEERVMIACDRCDEWYHTSCVDMPDLEVDLVDQFICPVCVAKHPNLPLKTTYKTRCFAGLNHPNPASPEACHKPARGAFSKYCSDDCGVKYISGRIDAWGGDKRALWEFVKHAEPRQAVVLKVVSDDTANGVDKDGGTVGHETRMEIVAPTKTQAQRELQRLEAALSRVIDKREALNKDQEVLQWRERVVQLAATRAERVQECGWDQRLCFGDEEVLEYGSDVADTYEEDERRESPDGMQVDGVAEWWCRGKKKCDRHAGWQKLRQAEVELERELQDAQLDKLTTQEREIRKQIEGVMDHTSQKPSVAVPSPLQPYNGETPSKPPLKAQPNGIGKKGKKRKAES